MKKLHTLAALLSLSLAASAGALGTASGTTISNIGFVDYTDDTGSTGVAQSTPVVANVVPVFAVSVTPDGTTAAPGQIVYTNNTPAAQNVALTYTLTNPGNTSDTYTISTFATTAPGAVTYYADTNNDGVYSAGDAQITGNVTLAADAILKFFAVTTVAVNTPGGTSYDVTPRATSVGDNTKVDSNNLGRITVKNVYDLSFAASQTGTVNTPGNVTYNHTITNTGNVSLTAAQINVTAAAADTVTGAGAFTQSYSTGTGVNPTLYATPQAAINAALTSPLPAGGALQLNVVVTANNALAAGNKEILTLGALITGVTNSATANNNEPTAINVTDTTTVLKGTGAVTKTQALCGTSGSTTTTCPASTSTSTAAINVRPGDYVVYYLTATNTGTGNIYNTRVRDALPAGVSIYSLAATSTQAGTILYSTNGANWFSNPTSLTVNNGATVYAAVDTNADGTITLADTTAAGKNVIFRIKVKVNDGVGAVQTAPATDTQTLN